MVDALDSKSSTERCEGSSPSLPTTHYSHIRCCREVKANARMKLGQTEMVEVDLLRKQFMGVGIPAMGAGEIGSNPIDLVKRWMQAHEKVDAYI